MFLLLDRRLAAGEPGRGDEPDGFDPSFPVRREHGHGAAFGVSDDGDPVRIDIGPAAEPVHDADHVGGIVVERSAFDAPAAQADASLVVPQDEKPAVRDRTGELAEDGDAGDDLVPILAAAAGDEDDGWQPFRPPLCGFGRARRRFADGSAEVEPGRRNEHVFVAGPADPFFPREHGREVVADHRHG